MDLLSTANRQLARYDGLLQSIINPEVLLSPLRTQEAVLSSKIEGTQATLKEVLEYEAEKEYNLQKNKGILKRLLIIGKPYWQQNQDKSTAHKKKGQITVSGD